MSERSASSAVVPAWAGFFEGDEFVEFVAVVHRDLERRGVAAIADGVADLTLPDGQSHRLGLQNLAQLCNQAGRDQWDQIVREHFDRVLVSTQTHDLEALGKDFDAVERLLKVRLYARSSLGELTDSTVHRVLCDELMAVLVYDLPDAVATVPTDVPAGWPCTLEQAFELGLRNVLDQDPVGLETLEFDDGVRCDALLGDSFFVTSHLLVLDEYLDPVPPMGALVAVPNRHTLLFAPILDYSILETLMAMVLLSHRRYEDGPGSLVPTVFWWRDGDLVPLPAEVGDEGVQFFPPQEFVEGCLERLAKPSAYGPN